MFTLRSLTLFVAVVAITASQASAGSPSEPHRGESLKDGGTPIALSVRGGVLQGSRFKWSMPPTSEVSSLTIPTVGVSLEAHGVYGFVIGAGFDASRRDWSIQSPQIGTRARSLTTYSAYGTLGIYLWTSDQSRPTSWISIDAGEIWARESGPTSTATLAGSFRGTLLRLRVSGMWPVSKWLALGGDVGWQWARPSANSDNTDETRHLDLSGPQVNARVSLLGPLGKE